MSDPLAEAARLIGEASRKPSIAAAIRSLLDQIDAATARGVPQTDIVSALVLAGYPVTIHQFRNYLYRARLSRAKQKALPHARSPSAAPPARPAAPPTTAPADRFDWQQHRDKNPDW